MTFPRFALPLTALALAAGSMAAVPPASRREAPRPAAAPDSTVARADAGRIQGSPSAKVWLIEASDFQCPFCKQWHDASYAAIVKEYVATGKVRFAFLNDPLSMHVHAMQAAEAAMCASAQGRFWPMHEALFETQERWDGPANPAAVFDSLAVKVGVDAAAWRTCVSTHATLPMITADQSRLRASGVQATPTFFIGGQKFEGVLPTADLRKALDAALAKAGAN